ncbi:MAG: WYL domain-containing protein [Acidimicrobiales bacterium]
MAGPTERVLQLLSLLQTHQHWRGSDLATRSRSERTVRRRPAPNPRLPGGCAAGGRGRAPAAAGAHLPPLLLDDDEAVAVAVGLRSATAGGLPGIDDTVPRVLLKLEQVLPDRLRRRVRALVTNTAVLTWGTPAASLDADALATLAQACRDHEEVRFAYRSRDGADSDRLVQPHQLVVSGRTWCSSCAGTAVATTGARSAPTGCTTCACRRAVRRAADPRRRRRRLRRPIDPVGVFGRAPRPCSSTPRYRWWPPSSRGWPTPPSPSTPRTAE